MMTLLAISSMTPYLALLRYRQYVKNLFLFLPLFFALKIHQFDLLFNTFLAFLCFCAIASAVYIFNDYLDQDEDRKHPVKKDRPLAAGSIPLSTALGMMAVLGGGGLLFSYWLHPHFFYFSGGYLLLNIAYSLKLKHIALLDIFIIASGFVIRIFAGASVGEVEVRMWILLMTFLLALFLGLAKRRDDVILAARGNTLRKSLDGYNLEFVNAGMLLMAPVILVAYILYTISPEVTERFQTPYLYFTAVLVILGLLRYFQITLVENNSGNPTELFLKDRFLQLTILAWLLLFVILIY